MSEVANCRNRLDFHELVGIAQDRDAQQSAGHVVVTKVFTHNVPRGQ